MAIDLVNHPPHYTSGKYEVIDVLEDWFAHEPLLWQVAKYIARWDKKGDKLENLEKAEFYLKRKIEQLKNAKRVDSIMLNAARFTGLPPRRQIPPLQAG